jgi:hypothetical protein
MKDIHVFLSEARVVGEALKEDADTVAVEVGRFRKTISRMN